MLRRTPALFSVTVLLALTACGDGASGYGKAASPTVAPATKAAAAATSTLTLTSDAFTNNGTIPVKYSCSGEATSPALSWSGAPAGTEEFVLIVHDPDAPLAGGFTHWIVTGIPASAKSLPAAVPADKVASQPVAYRGMCPPVGAAAHHYHFRLYALSAPLDNILPGTTKESVEAAIQPAILAQTDLVALFGR